MRVLGISLDTSLVVRNESTAGDTLERHVRYAAALQQRDPESELVMVVPVPAQLLSRRFSASPGSGLTIHAVPHARRLLRSPALLREVGRILAAKSFDVITTQTPFDDGLLGVWSSRRSGVPLHVQMRGSFLDEPNWIRLRPWLYPVLNQIGKWVAHGSARIRVVSDGERRRLEQRFPGLRGKVRALHPLVNLARFAEPVAASEERAVSERLRAAAASSALPPFVLYVGRLSAEKNLPTLLRAWAEVGRQQADAWLVLAGDGPERATLQRLALELGISQRVLWLGEVALGQLRPWYQAARASVLPSFYEGFGKVIVESYLMGTPVVTTPFVSAAELIPSAASGSVLRHFTDPSELAAALVRLCADRELGAAMGRRGQAHVHSYLLSADAYFARLIELWQEAATSAHPRRAL